MELRKITRRKFKLTMSTREFNTDMMAWAESVFGTGSGRGTWRYGWGHWAKGIDSTHQFWFRKEEDATMFMLRWR